MIKNETNMHWAKKVVENWAKWKTKKCKSSRKTLHFSFIQLNFKKKVDRMEFDEVIISLKF